MRRLHTSLVLLALLMALSCVSSLASTEKGSMTALAEQFNIPYGSIDNELVGVAYSGGERFRYDISYTGGFKLGELHLEIRPDDTREDSYTISARVTTENGIFSHAYPIEDLHVTQVTGERRLPYHYEVWQKEGYSYEAHRVTRYDQRRGKVFYRLNEQPVEIYEIGAAAQNEFSAFFASRVMPHVPGKPFIVPTFADEKRIEVVVMVKGNETLKKTVLGTVDTKVVEPIMTFSGLYDKRGDTVIWYTDDECRVPVLINSKVLIGSLTARLVAYENAACPRYSGAVLEKYSNEKRKDNVEQKQEDHDDE